MEQLELCVDYLWKSERHELIADINKPVIAVFEKRRDFKVTIKTLSTPGGLCVCVCICVCIELRVTVRVCLCVPTEAVRAVLRHPSLLSQGDRGGELRKAAFRSLLPRSFLRTGERQVFATDSTHTYSTHTYSTHTYTDTLNGL